ncbi:MAG: hypothetical protein NUV91_07490 [Candidatus Omnitrophica bacterium]|nr:hypothetical protein [Candidatus Omnitrophota bacterium]
MVMGFESELPAQRDDELEEVRLRRDEGLTGVQAYNEVRRRRHGGQGVVDEQAAQQFRSGQSQARIAASVNEEKTRRRRTAIYSILEAHPQGIGTGDILRELKARGFKDITDSTIRNDLRLDSRLGDHGNLRRKPRQISDPETVRERRDALFSILERQAATISRQQLWLQLIQNDQFAKVSPSDVVNDTTLDARLKDHSRLQVRDLATGQRLRDRRNFLLRILKEQEQTITSIDLWEILKTRPEYAEATLKQVRSDIAIDRRLRTNPKLRKSPRAQEPRTRQSKQEISAAVRARRDALREILNLTLSAEAGPIPRADLHAALTHVHTEFASATEDEVRHDTIEDFELRSHPALAVRSKEKTTRPQVQARRSKLREILDSDQMPAGATIISLFEALRQISGYENIRYNTIFNDVTRTDLQNHPKFQGVQAPLAQASATGENYIKEFDQEFIQLHNEAVRWVLDQIVHELLDVGFDVEEDGGIYDFDQLIEDYGENGVVELPSGGKIYKDGNVLIIIDSRFNLIDHAGRGTYQPSVYASDENKVKHELAELIDVLRVARKNAILLEDDPDELLGARIQEFGNGLGNRHATTDQEELFRRQNLLINILNEAHRAGLEAEGRGDEFVPSPYLKKAMRNFDIRIAAGGGDKLSLAKEFFIYLRSTHDHLNDEGNFGRVIRGQIAPLLMVELIMRGRILHYKLIENEQRIPDLKQAARDLGAVGREKAFALSGAEYPQDKMYLTKDGIVVIIHHDFQADHAGRGTYQLAVYARNATKAKHELAELEFLINEARQIDEEGIRILEEGEDAENLGINTQDYANGTFGTRFEIRGSAATRRLELIRRQNHVIGMLEAAHKEGMRAEGRPAAEIDAYTLPRLDPATDQPIENFDIRIASEGAPTALRRSISDQVSVWHYFNPVLSRRGFFRLAGGLLALAPAALSAQPVARVKSFFIVGMNHQAPNDDAFQARLVQAASQRKIVLGIEGLVRNEAQEQEFLQNAYALQDKGFTFGYEDEFANKYSGSLLHYGYLSNGMKEQEVTTKAQLIYDLRQSENFRKYWQKLRERSLGPSVKTLYDQLTRYYQENKGADLRSFVNKFADSLGTYGTNQDWIALLKEIILVMNEDIKGFTGDFQLNLGRIESYLQDPKNVTHQSYVVEEVNGKWRDKFILKNMREIAAIAESKGLDVYFLVGRGHVQNLSAALHQGTGKLVMRVYATPHIIAPQYLPWYQSGQMKSLGVREAGSIEAEQDLSDLHEVWTGQAVQTPQQSLTKIMDGRVRSEIQARVIYSDHPRLERAGGYYFQVEKPEDGIKAGEWVIVVNRNDAFGDAASAIAQETLFHEAAEIWLRTEHDYSEREAHVIASAMQRQEPEFAPDGGLTAYDRYQLETMPIERLRQLRREYATGRRHREHYPILREAAQRGIPLNADEAIAYEENVFQQVIVDRLFDQYWVDNDLAEYRYLRDALERQESFELIKAELIDDSAVRMVFLKRLSSEEVGEIIAAPDTRDGDHALMQQYASFSVGEAAVANRLAGQGIPIIAGLVDRASWDTFTYEVANARQPLFPLGDGTFIGNKGGGQFLFPRREPFFWLAHNWNKFVGLASKEEAQQSREAAGALSSFASRFPRMLGYQPVLWLPNKDGNFQPVASLNLKDKDARDFEPVLVFNIYGSLHRLDKFPQLIKSDSHLDRLSWRISRTLSGQGILPAGTAFSGRELIYWLMGRFGETQALKQNTGWYKKTLHSQDFVFDGREADREEFDQYEDHMQIVDARGGVEAGDYELLRDQHLSTRGMEVLLLTLQKMIQSAKENNQEEDLFPDRLEVLKNLFQKYFEQLDEEYLRIWATAFQEPGAEGFVMSRALRNANQDTEMRMDIFHPASQITEEKNREQTAEVNGWILQWAKEELAQRIRGADNPSAEGITGQSMTPGGIDFNPNKMDLQTRGEGMQSAPIFDPSSLENVIIDGFMPVILNIQPVTNFDLLLGETTEENSGRIS